MKIKKLQFNINSELKKDFKKYAINHDTTMTIILVEYIVELLKSEKV